MTRESDARRPLDPFIAGLTDGATSGYHTVDRVVQGLRDGLRRQGSDAPGTAAGPAGPGAPGPQGRARTRRLAAGGTANPAPDGASSSGVVDGVVRELADIAADLVGAASSVTRGVAGIVDPLVDPFVDSYRRPKPGPLERAHIEIRARAGESAIGRFYLWNTGVTSVPEVRFHATELLGAATNVPRGAISFDPDTIKPFQVRDHRRIEVQVQVPAGIPVGHYHGTVQATGVGTWATIALEVTTHTA